MTDDSQTNQTQPIVQTGAQTGSAGTTGAGATQEPKKNRIPDYIRAKYPNLEELINSTESMTKEEREYWFQILPIMTDQQIDKLQGILVHEKEQLSKLDKQYEAELSKLNEKHIMEWKEQERREQRETLLAQEKQVEAEEKAAEEDILSQLNTVEDDPTTGGVPTV